MGRKEGRRKEKEIEKVGEGEGRKTRGEKEG